MIRVSLLHVTRQRPQLSYDTCLEWIRNCANKEELECILAIDNDDPTLEDYRRIFVFSDADKPGSFKLNITDSRSGVQALNNAAKVISTSTELIVSVEDDQSCFLHWDLALFQCLEGIDNFKAPVFLWVGDGHNSQRGLAPYYCANRAYYERVGYILYHEYDGVFADNDMIEVAKLICMKDVRHLIFQHRHWTLGLFPKDEISKKNDAAENPDAWSRNLKIFEDRCRRNFDL